LWKKKGCPKKKEIAHKTGKKDNISPRNLVDKKRKRTEKNMGQKRGMKQR